MMVPWIKRIWWVTVAAVVLQVALSYQQLPERMASHFNGSGKADGWSSRTEFLLTWVLVIVIVNVWPLIMGPLIRKLPRSMLNLPNKEFWLATPERARYATDVTVAMMCGTLAGANLLLLLAYQHTWEYNVQGASGWNIWIGLIVEMVVTLGVVAWGLIRLNKTELPQTLSSTNV